MREVYAWFQRIHIYITFFSIDIIYTAIAQGCVRRLRGAKSQALRFQTKGTIMTVGARGRNGKLSFDLLLQNALLDTI